MNIGRSRSGMVLITAMLIVLVVSILSLSVISHNASQASTERERIDQIRAQEFGQGVYAYKYNEMAVTKTKTPSPATMYESQDGKNYTSTVSTLSPGKFSISINY